MKIIKGMEDIYSISASQRKLNEKSNTCLFEEIRNIMTRKASNEIHTQITAVFHDISVVTEKNSSWQAITIAKDKNGKAYWFSHNKNQNIPELMYYHNATKILTMKND